MKKEKKRYGWRRNLLLASVLGILAAPGLIPAREAFAAREMPAAEEAASEPETLVRYSEIYDTKEEIPEPEAVWEAEDGIVWKLSESRLLTVPLTSRSRMLSGEVVYPGVTREAEIPPRAVMEVEDKESGQVFEAELPLSRSEYLKERWEPDLEFTVTFHRYGSDGYRLGEILIPHQAEQPPLSDCREALLEAIGLPAEDCRIEEMSWAGESYPDENGILCRDARVTGARRLWDCRAVYEGETALPDVIRYRMQMEYRPLEPEKEAGKEAGETGEKMDAGAGADTEENLSGSSQIPLWQQLFTRGLTVSVSLVFLIFLLAGFRGLKRRAAALDADRKN